MTWLTLTFRSSRPEVFSKKGVLRIFAKFTGTHLYYLKNNLYFLLNIFRFCDHSFSTFAKFFQKNNIYYPLICKRTCAYQGVRNVTFSENFAYVSNEWSLFTNSKNLKFMLLSITMKLGDILVQLMNNIFNIILVPCWSLETTSRLFYDFIKMLIL